MLGPALASFAFGLMKGLTSRSEPQPFRLQQDFLGPVTEEMLYRAAPLAVAPSLPFGSTAAVFAVDHLAHDMRQHPMTMSQAVARFGDVLLGGSLYEAAYRSAGLGGAVLAHVAHNFAVSLGERASHQARQVALGKVSK